MKTDLAKTLSVRGQRGLFTYIAQSRNGAIAESLRDHNTLEGELKLKEVFLKLQSVLGDADAPSSKDDVSKIKALFDKAVPDYDGDRFYVSHMKKVVDWYNELKNYASLDFVEEEEEAAEPEA